MGTLLLAGDLPQFGSNSRGIILFGFEIYYYAICIVTGMIVAAVLSALLMKRRNMSPDLIYTLFICCIPTALVCARLYYCITQPLPFSQWLDVRDGGLSVIGGVVGGVLAGFIVCRVKKINFFRAADCVVVNILFAQAIGRLGNYFNQEVYGALVTDPAQQWAPFAVFIEDVGEWHYAFCFYEMFFNLIGFGLLFAAVWYWNKKPNGVFTFAYFLWYGIVRTVMEPLRDPKYILSGGDIPWSLVTSILYIVFGAVGIGVLLFLNYRKEGAIFGSKKGDPCGITQYLSPNKDEVPYFSKINMLGASYPPAPPKPTKEERRAAREQKRAEKLAAKQAAQEAGQGDNPKQNTEEAAGDTAEQSQREDKKEE